jgi:GH25 family lysozyme M1 (1,4-beta-N-acetylmuramidase)
MNRFRPATLPAGRLRLGLRRTPILAVLIAICVLPVAAASVQGSSTSIASNCAVNLRSRPSMSGTVKKVIPLDTVVTMTEKVWGGAWSADCKTWVKGSSWFKITAINGHSVSSLLGVSAVYAATGLFRAASSSYAYGVDVSSWQGSIDFSKVKASGRRFVIAKASEGNTWTDATYAHNKSAAMSVGLKFTGYHFARPGTNAGDAVSEADHFVSVLGLKHGMLVPALDLEVTGGLGITALQNWTKAFVGRVYSRLGVKPMIYTSPSFWQTYLGNTTWFSSNGYRVWIANWGVSSPSVPATSWAGKGWTFWQYSDCGSVSGISGCVDLDRLKSSDFTGVTF